MLWLDIDEVNSYGMIFNAICGNRGGGKSYTTVKYALQDEFIYLRRTERELDSLCAGSDDLIGNPVSDVCLHEYNFIPDYVKRTNGIYTIVDNNQKRRGLMMALSTFSTKRGFEYEQCNTIVFDECVPEQHVKLFKAEDDAFFNFYESIARNRELIGRPPIRCYIIFNSNNLTHPLLQSLQIDKMYMQCMKKEKYVLYDKNRSLLLYLQAGNEYINAKKETALYKLTKGTKFYGMALDNEFVYDDMTDIRPCPLAEYTLLVSHELVDVWKHKNCKNFYICKHNVKINGFLNILNDNIKFCEKTRAVYNAYLRHDVKFENLKAKTDFLKLV